MSNWARFYPPPPPPLDGLLPIVNSAKQLVNRLAYEGVANGVATLGADSKVLPAQLPAFVALDANNKVPQRLAYEAVAGGVATLDASTKLVQRLGYEGVASGVATLDANTKVLQRLAYEGLASGVPTLDAAGMVLDSGGRKIVASGTSADGNYVRFADGTQICSLNAVRSSDASGNASVPWPATFTAMYGGTVTNGDNAVGVALLLSINSSGLGLTSLSVRVVVSTSGAVYTGSVRICAVAVGRWY